VVIAAVSETMHPETLFSALDRLHEQHPTLEMHTIALIDLRTCDCFPNVREVLERHADTVIMLPYDLSEVVEALA